MSAKQYRVTNFPIFDKDLKRIRKGGTVTADKLRVPLAVALAQGVIEPVDAPKSTKAKPKE